MSDETLRERAARETAKAFSRKFWDEPLLKALGVQLFEDKASVKLSPEQARVTGKLDEIFEDENEAIRSKELEDLRGCS